MASSLSPKNDFKTKFYKSIMPKIYGIGASIVIAGAMFKLLNWPGGALMLGLGLTTEAVIFFLSSFEPQEKEVDWSKVYPELLEDHQGGATKPRSCTSGPIGEKLDEMFAQAQIDSVLIENLGQGMHRLSESAAYLASMPELSVATEKYTASIEKATEVLENMHEAQAGALGAIRRLVNVSQETQDYHKEVQNVTETLGALNLAYKRELQEAELRSTTTRDVHMHIAESMARLQIASHETEKFKTELAQLSEKLASLNNIYGNMLTALKS